VQGGLLRQGTSTLSCHVVIETLTTYALRSGGATMMLLKGATLAKWCAKRRWASEKSLLRYLRSDPDMAALLETVMEFWKRKD
jgi:hypothetical protein